MDQGSGSTNEFNIAVGLVAKTAMLGNAIRLFHFSNQRNIRSPIIGFIGNILKFVAKYLHIQNLVWRYLTYESSKHAT